MGNIERLKKISYVSYDLIAINLANVRICLNLVTKLKLLTKGFPKMCHLSFFINLAESYDKFCIFHCI